MATKSTGSIVDGGTVPILPTDDGIINATGVDNGSGSGETIHGYDTFDPTSGTASSGSSTTKRRGRPPGRTGTGTTPAPKKANLEGIELILLSGHEMMAAFLETPEFALSKDEAEKLSGSIQRVASFYDAAGLAPKAVAWLNLTMCVGGLYGPRIIAVMAKDRSKKKTLKIEPKPVAQFPSPANPPQQSAATKPNGAPAPPTTRTPSELWSQGVDTEDS